MCYMTYKDILYVVTICDEKSFSRAAQKLFISQSALSQAIHKLEKELGFPLFFRNGTYLTPTAACHMFAEKGRAVIRAWEKFDMELGVYRDTLKSQLTVGVPAWLFKNLLPYVLPLFRKEHPEVNIKLIDERSDTLETLITEDIINLCVIQEPTTNPSIARIPVFSTEFLLAVPCSNAFCRRHPYRGLQQLEYIDLSELRNEPFSLLKNKRVDYLWKPLFQSAGFTPNVFVWSSIWNNIKDIVKRGDSVALIDEIVVRHEPDDDKICYYRLQNTPVQRQTIVAYHPGKQLTLPEQWFIEAVRQYPAITASVSI